MAARGVDIGDVGQRVATSVATLRRRHGWDQRQLVERVVDAGRPMTVPILSRVEAGTRRVDVDDLVALAFALEVPPARLLLTDDPDRAPAAEHAGDVASIEEAVREDIEVLGDLKELDDTAPSLAAIAVRLAQAMDGGGGEGGAALHSLAKELRAVLAELRALVPEEPPDDDDLGDLAAAT